MKRALQISFRFVLTVAAVFAFYSVYQVTRVSDLALFAPNGPAFASRAQYHPAAASLAERLWPLFPGTKVSGLHKMKIAGTRILTESWESAASAESILDFYLDQMTARGWALVPEETVDWRRSVIPAAGGTDPVRGQMAAALDEALLPMLALSRGDWSLTICVGPGSRAWTRNVKILCVEASSIGDFGLEFAQWGELPEFGAESRPVEIEEDMGRDSYRSQVTVSKLQPAEYFRLKLDELRRENWRAAATLAPDRKKNGRLFGLFQRGANFAYLVIAPAPGGSSAVLTQVTDTRFQPLENHVRQLPTPET